MKTIPLSGFLALALGACSSATVAQFSPDPEGGSPLADSGFVPVANNTGIIVADSHSVTGTSIGPTGEVKVPQLSVREESDLVFNILSAEIAGRRGLVEVASENYFEAAVATDDPRVSERAVKLALYGRDWQRADLASARWVELAPENVEAWQHRAQASIQLKDVEKATAAIEQLVTLSNDEPGAVIPSVVDSILRQADTEVGSELLDRLAARYPDSADTQYGIGRFAMSKGERELALQAFERALALDPDNVETLLSRARIQLSTGVGDKALEPVDEYLSRSPDDLTAQLGFTRLLIDGGKVDRAAEHFEVIYTQFPEDADALYTTGLMALDIQRINSAEKYLSAVTALDKHQDNANYYLGRISDSRQDYQDAIDRYLQVQGGENFFTAQIRAGELYGVVGDVERGRSLLAELRTYTDDATLKLEMINSESILLNANDLLDESLELLTDSLDQYKDDSGLLYARALVAEKLGKRSVFEADLKKIIEMQPDTSQALNALGYFLADRNERLDEAEEYLAKAYKLSPDDAAITDSLGWLYYRQGRYAESLELLQKAYKALPDPEIAAHLGEVLWVSGDQAGATEIWEEALRITPDDDLLNNVMKKYVR